MSHPSLWIALAVCLLSGYFAACNIAIKTFSRARLMDRLEERGQQARFDPFIRRRANLILMTGTLRIGLNLLALLVALHYFEITYPHLGWLVCNGLALLFTGVMVSVFSVAIPVSVARYQGERLLTGSIPFLNACLAVIWPVAAGLHLLDPLVRRIFGETTQGDSSQLSDEILSVVEEHGNMGEVDQGQKEMLEAVVEFPSTTVGQIMTPRTDVHGIEVELGLDQVRSAVLGYGHSRIPIYEESLDHIIGVLYVKDLIEFIGNDRSFELRKIVRDALMVPESKPVKELLAEFKAKKVHMAIVLDEYGGTAGLVTIEDILEEIVGEIHDEYEPTEETPHIDRVDDHTVEVDARVYIYDLNDELELELPEDEDYDTVGGFVFSTLGHIPEAGEGFDFEGVRFTVTAAERTKVSRVRLDLAGKYDQLGHGGAVKQPRTA